MMKKDTYLTAQYFLNHKLNLEVIKKHVIEFADKGFQGIFAHARQGLLTPYMSEEWWKVIREIVSLCKELEVELWIWDEDYFPSGLAGGRIIWEHPELAACNLNFKTGVFENQDEIEMDFSDGFLLKAFAVKLHDNDVCSEMTDISKFCGTRRSRWTDRKLRHTMYSPLLMTSGNPHWRCSFEDNKFAVYWQPPEKAKYLIIGITAGKNENRLTNILDPETTKLLLENTYDEYLKRHQNDFGQIIAGAFFDEPSPGCAIYPWSRQFPEEFKNEHGYDIVAHLAHLAWDIDEKTPLIRHDFRMTQHRLQTSSYLNKTHEWCKKNNIIFTGHLTRTEWLSLTAAWWPNELRCYKHMDIPCCDPLGKAYGWKDLSAYHTGIKTASSAAHIFGKRLAGSDCLAVIGDEVCLRDLKGLLDYQIALGINFFVAHGYSYSIDGPRKDEVPPSLFYQHSEWEYMECLSDYLKDVSEQLSGGKHICKILMLYPSTSLACQQKPSNDIWDLSDGSWCNLKDERKIHDLVETMLSNHKDFDFIDEITLDEVIEENGDISLKEPYETIVLPHLKHISHDAAKALERYSANNGKIICVGSVPLVIPENLNENSRKFEAGNYIAELTIDNIDPLLPSIVEINGRGKNDVLAYVYKKDEKIRIFVYNRSEDIFNGAVNGAPVEIHGKSGSLIDPEHIEAVKMKTIQEESLNCGWSVTFEDNHLPLNFWQAIPKDEMEKAAYSSGESFDLMTREKCPSGPGIFRCRFNYSGKINDMKIVMEESSLSGEWELQVNGCKIENWKYKTVFDCKNIEANITDCLKSANSPVINTVDIVMHSQEGRLQDMPYLLGKFRCRYTHGHKSFPDLAGNDSLVRMNILSDWANTGYPGYSGTATYSKDIEIAEDGKYLLDLGRVEDIAEIIINEKTEAVLPWPPYKKILKLSKGTNNIKIKIANGPGNRYRLVALPAGLLGPVNLSRIEN